MHNQTHVQIPENLTTPLSTIQLNDDGIGYAKTFDFSRANLNEESRIAAISTVASVCYQNPKAAGSISLYNRLANESAGLPSSSFEFVPILLEPGDIYNILSYSQDIHGIKRRQLSVEKYGEFIKHDNLDGNSYLLTNLRALLADVGDKANEFFNSEEECKIISKHFHVFQTKIDLATARQFMRHRVIWQELSRRYVSGVKTPIEFYMSKKLKEVYSDHKLAVLSTEKLMSMCLDHYFEALTLGVKPEEARRILPQAMYTTIWSAWMPSQFDSFLKLRLDSHTQIEHQHLARAMLQLTNDKQCISEDNKYAN